jgi:hypothetical protein
MFAAIVVSWDIAVSEVSGYVLNDQCMFPVEAGIISISHYVQSSSGTRPKDVRRRHFRRRWSPEPRAGVVHLALMKQWSEVYLLLTIAL